jgi:hypothetical protein
MGSCIVEAHEGGLPCVHSNRSLEFLNPLGDAGVDPLRERTNNVGRVAIDSGSKVMEGSAISLAGEQGMYTHVASAAVSARQSDTAENSKTTKLSSLNLE